MKIINIRESGSNATLMWALKNGGNPKTDDPLMSCINDELFYHVTLGDVNFLELFRLTQMYREKLRIVNMYEAGIPPRDQLLQQFPGTYDVTEEGQEPMQSAIAQLVELAVMPFMKLVNQMEADDDIIQKNAAIMFVPMICRKFDVQIPLGFYPFISAMNVDEAAEIFNDEYPATLSKIIEFDIHSVKTAISMDFVKSIGILRYDKRYDQYLKMLKYAPLKTSKSDKLYKFGLLGFHKYDNVSRGEVRCPLTPTPPKADDFAARLKRMATLTTPLMVDFAISLPLQYMQILENTYSREELPISYESSMSTILDGNLVYHDFILPQEESDDPEKAAHIEQVNNAISAYKVRMQEANQAVVSALPTILDDPDSDVTGAFAMLPSIYNAKAVITIDITKSKTFTDCNDPVLAAMFTDIMQSASAIMGDINKAK